MKAIKQFIVYVLFYIGHITCKTYFINTHIGYKLYQWSMLTSNDLQIKWSLNKPWKDYE